MIVTNSIYPELIRIEIGDDMHKQRGSILSGLSACIGLPGAGKASLLTMALMLVVPGMSEQARAEQTGDTARDMKLEITHLMRHVERSGCVFIRNGDQHDPMDAANHIRKKYEHFKDDIESTETFIKLSATRSLISRKPYHIQCPGQIKQPSGEWLLAELARFRSQVADATVTK